MAFVDEQQEKVSIVRLKDRFAFLDPAAGKQGRERLKTGLARSAIVVVAQDSLQRVFVLEAWAKRCSTPDLVAEMLRIQQEWKILSFGVEANAMQSLFIDTVDMLAKERKVKLPLAPIYQNTRIDKMFRIRAALQPVLAEGRLILGENQMELRSELKAFPRGQTVDLVDALASVVKMLPELPKEDEVGKQADGLAKYLRDQGVSPAYIEQRMTRFYADNGVERQINPLSDGPKKGRVMQID